MATGADLWAVAFIFRNARHNARHSAYAAGWLRARPAGSAASRTDRAAGGSGVSRGVRGGGARSPVAAYQRGNATTARAHSPRGAARAVETDGAPGRRGRTGPGAARFQSRAGEFAAHRRIGRGSCAGGCTPELAARRRVVAPGIKPEETPANDPIHARYRRIGKAVGRSESGAGHLAGNISIAARVTGPLDPL